MIHLSTGPLSSIAVIGAHCDDIAIGAGGTLLEITKRHPDVQVHALVLTGAGTEREIEEKAALTAFCGDVRLTVGDLPDGRLPQHWSEVKRLLAEFRRDCDPDIVFAPHRQDRHQDHRLIAELVPTEFRTFTSTFRLPTHSARPRCCTSTTPRRPATTGSTKSRSWP
jgi:LmbE family N-acetylglucosaminyl deacetylase